MQFPNDFHEFIMGDVACLTYHRFYFRFRHFYAFHSFLMRYGQTGFRAVFNQNAYPFTLRIPVVLAGRLDFQK